MIRKTILGMAFISSFISVQALATTDVQTNATAIEIVNQYKALRSQCATTKGDSRKDCFSDLEAKNQAYRQAKKQLTDTEKTNNVRLVSLAY